MRKRIGIACLAAICLANVGCALVVGNKGTLAGTWCRKQAVALNGKIYIVDVGSGEVCVVTETELDSASLVPGVSFSERDVTIIED